MMVSVINLSIVILQLVRIRWNGIEYARSSIGSTGWCPSWSITYRDIIWCRWGIGGGAAAKDCAHARQASTASTAADLRTVTRNPLTCLGGLRVRLDDRPGDRP